jgi:hypothetical protein
LRQTRPDEIPWGSLSPRSQATLRLIALPLSQTSSPTDLATTLSCSTYHIRARMDELANELKALLRDD